MTGIYAPFIFAGGGQWFKHHVLLLDNAGCLVSVHPFQGETERTTAYTGIVLPAFSTNKAGTTETALEWLIARLNTEEGAVLSHLLERVLPEITLLPGKAVRLWNLEGVNPDTLRLDAEAVLRPIYP